jgi:DNA-binding PadR family transcriptional regulator
MTTLDEMPSTERTRGGLPRRFLRPFLLLALASEEAAHGYELYECVRGHGVSVDLAGVYRDLRAMEQHDLVTSRWEPSDAGPDRRVYALNDDGCRAAEAATLELSTIRDRLGSALEAFSAVAERGLA